MRQYVKLIRFHNNGFKTTPYNSTSFPHVMPFINYEVTDLEKVNAVVSESDFINPIKDDENWKGCFVFLEKYNKDLLSKGALVMRQGHRKNVAYWKAYVNQYKETLEHDGQPYNNFKYISYYSSYYWVKMKIELALQRIILGEQHFGYIPEWLSECYIMDHQVKQFKTSKLFILREQMGRFLSLK